VAYTAVKAPARAQAQQETATRTTAKEHDSRFGLEAMAIHRLLKRTRTSREILQANERLETPLPSTLSQLQPPPSSRRKALSSLQSVARSGRGWPCERIPDEKPSFETTLKRLSKTRKTKKLTMKPVVEERAHSFWTLQLGADCS